MKTRICIVLVAALLGAGPAGALAAQSREAEHIQKTIADHRAISDAHRNAAKCLESGTPEKECHAQLAKECTNLAIGKYCGMRSHRH